MQIDLEKLVEWDENAQRFVFTGEFTGGQDEMLPIRIFEGFDGAKVRGANVDTEINHDGELVVTGFAGALAGVVESSIASQNTGLDTDEMLVHSDYFGEYFRLGLVLSDDKEDSTAAVKKLLEQASFLGETLELA